MASPTISQGLLKSVISGDTVVVRHLLHEKQERTLHLAFVSAPHLRREGDEPFAFAAREYLRQKIVGKIVQFQTLYTVPTGTGSVREFVKITTKTGESFPELSITDGWVKLRDDASKKVEDSDAAKSLLEKYELLEATAKADGKGLWGNKDGAQPQVQYDIPDPKAFFETWKNKKIEGIVERVLTGDRFLVRFLLDASHHTQTLALLAGIRAPATKRTNPSTGTEQAGEPFGEAAQLFMEVRCLQRHFEFEIVGLSPQNQLICTLEHFKYGNPTLHLTKEGLARCNDHHSTMAREHMSKLRKCEKEAQENKRNIFKDHVDKATAGDSEVIVSRVQTADTIYVRSRVGPEKRIGLSSIRQPKPTDPKQAPFQAEAKEWLRKKLIGKHVRLTIDGKKAASEGYEEREVGTVMLHDKNIALEIIQAGYGSVIRHRRDDTDRSPAYDELLAAEEAAIKDEKGMHSPKPPAVKNYVDYSESLQKAKIQSSVLQRQKKIPAIVDFVKSGSRFTVLIPRENAKLTLVLSCIRAPRSARNATESSEPFGQEAHDLANRKCFQRDVEIDIEGVDKVGGFIGTLYVNRENFSRTLLEEGFAKVHAYSAEQNANGAELFAAEKKAQEARKGLWKDYDPSQENGEEAVATTSANDPTTPAAPRKADYREVMLTHLDPSSLHLKVQVIGTGTGALEEMMIKFRNFHVSSSNSAPLPTPPKAGDYVSAKFSEDGQWYRARIRRNDRDAKASEVQYVDFGNEEKVPWTSLRPLAQQFSTSSLKAQAQDAVLSFLQFPVAKEYLDDAANYLTGELDGKKLVARVDTIDKEGTLFVTLYTAEDKEKMDSVNRDVVREGLAMVARKPKPFEKSEEDILKDLRKAEEEAKEGRKGMWEYGDLTED